MAYLKVKEIRLLFHKALRDFSAFGRFDLQQINTVGQFIDHDLLNHIVRRLIEHLLTIDVKNANRRVSRLHTAGYLHPNVILGRIWANFE